MVKKIIKRKAAPKDPLTLKVGEPITEEDITYWPIVGTDYFIGHDEYLKHFVYDPQGETGWEHLPGWAWYSDRKVMLRNFARFLNDEAPLPAIKGKPDKRWDGHVLIPVADAPHHPRFPVVDLDALPPNSETVMRWDPKTKTVYSLLTKDSDGVWLGWNQCGQCNRMAVRCECPKGCRPHRAVYWSCERSAAGWVTDHNSSKGYMPTRGTEGPGRAVGTLPLSKARRTAPRPAPDLPVTDDATGIVAGVDAGSLDLDAVTKAAEASADASTKAVRKVIKRKRAK